MYVNQLTDKQQSLIFLSFILLSISIGIYLKDYNEQEETYTITYEAVNIKNMTQPHIATKISNNTLVNEDSNDLQESLGNVAEVKMGSSPAAKKLSTTENVKENENKRIWY